MTNLQMIMDLIVKRNQKATGIHSVSVGLWGDIAEIDNGFHMQNKDARAEAVANLIELWNKE